MTDQYFYRRNLPHVRKCGATYFVTWRLHRRQSNLEHEERTIVTNALRFFDTHRYTLHAFVVMNDHVHVLVEPHGAHRLQDICRTWKSYSANRLQREAGRKGAIWQDESFDRVVRNEQEWIEKVVYILGNPAKRWPERGDYPWMGGRMMGD